jgi:hypothetical protein
MHAWPDLVRIERLGIMTCQRGSDLIRMGPKFRDGNGIWCQPKKTRKRRRVFHIPLATTGALEFDRWWVGDQVKKYKWDIDLTTQTIRPFTGSAAPASWRAQSMAMMSTRSPTTSACRARTSIITCASATRCRSAPTAKSGFVW